MSDETERTERAQQQEPSMEDILASIRRILSEDSEEGEPNPNDAQAPEAEAQAAVEADAEVPADPEPEQALSEPEPEPEPEPIEEPSSEPAPEPVAEAEPEPELVAEPEPAFEAQFDEPTPEEDPEDVLELTESMRVPEGEYNLVSRPTADVSTDVLADLAKAILNRRELSVGAPGITLESMVRGMLKPLLKEWLDRNLPYLIERLVKREIDLMVNRAEKLED